MPAKHLLHKSKLSCYHLLNGLFIYTLRTSLIESGLFLPVNKFNQSQFRHKENLRAQLDAGRAWMLWAPGTPEIRTCNSPPPSSLMDASVCVSSLLSYHRLASLVMRDMVAYNSSASYHITREFLLEPELKNAEEVL